MMLRIGSGLGLAGLLGVSALVIACKGGPGTGTVGNGSSSGTSGSTSTSGGTGTSSGAPSDDKPTTQPTNSCALEPGTYTIRYTTEPGGSGPDGADCPDLPDQTVTVKASSADGGTSPPAEGCETETDQASCKTTTNCENESSGFTTTTKLELTVKNGSATGSQSSKMVDEEGTVMNDCTYTFTYTKK